MIQHRLDIRPEITVDLFAGGGGTSTGIELGLGRPVDVAVDHDPEAIAMHQANHPATIHHCESVFAVDPVRATGNQPVGLLWASPDCTHHSRAKGGKPVSNKRRGLAWVVIKWARRTRPRVIMLENVEEFAEWGPLTDDGRPCRQRKGQTFAQWVGQLELIGYRVEWRTLRACDYGAPTIRKRLFLVARRDGLPIVWPAPTHGAPDSLGVQRGKLAAWRTAAECIDWSIPCPSIFDRARPLAENTLRRIARGVQRFVIEAVEPFIVSIGYGERAGQAPRVQDIRNLLSTVVAGGAKHALVTAFLAKHYGGNYTGPGVEMREPMSTVTTVDHHALVAATMLNLKGSDRCASAITDPARTVCAGGGHAALVTAFLSTYYGNGAVCDPREPIHTVTTKDRLQLVTVTIDGEQYVITDIGMRMLQPRELFSAQGFPDSYIIDRGPDGRALTKTAQVRMCGNSVSPNVAAALVRANFAHEAAHAIQQGVAA